MSLLIFFVADYFVRFAKKKMYITVAEFKIAKNSCWSEKVLKQKYVNLFI